MVFMNERQMNKYLNQEIWDKWKEYLKGIREAGRSLGESGLVRNNDLPPGSAVIAALT
jgi:hypothetical protein